MNYIDSRWYRWFAQNTEITLAGASAVSHKIDITLHNSGDAFRNLKISVNQHIIAQTMLRPGWQRIQILVPGRVINGGTPTVEFAIPPVQSNHTNGLAVANLSIKQLEDSSLTFGLIMSLVAVGILAGILGIAAGLSQRDLTIVTSISLVATGCALAFWRLQTITILPLLFQMAFIAILFILLLRIILYRRWQSLTPWFHRVVLLSAFLLILHATGMNALTFIDIDHRARANHVLQIAVGNAHIIQEGLSNQYEWGISNVPYSLLSYYFFIPLTIFFSSTLSMAVALKVAVSILNATIPLLIYWLMRQYEYSPRTCFLASALFIGLPINHLYFHDGSYPTIVGLWITIIMFISLHPLIHNPEYSLWQFVLTIGLMTISLLVYVTHIAFIPAVLFVAIALFFIKRSSQPHLWYRLLILLSISVTLALLLYYGKFALPVLMAVIERLQTGSRVGHDSLPSPLVGSLIEQMWGHTRMVPVFLLPIGIIYILRRGVSLFSGVMLGYILLLLLGILVDHQFSLWNKHWYFCLPAIAIVSGIALDAFNRFRFGNLVVAALITFLLFESTMAWLLRVFLYEWSLRTI